MSIPFPRIYRPRWHSCQCSCRTSGLIHSPRLYWQLPCRDVSQVSLLQPRQACRVDQQHSRETLQRHFELIYLVAFTQWWCTCHYCNGIIQFSASLLRLIRHVILCLIIGLPLHGFDHWLGTIPKLKRKLSPTVWLSFHDVEHYLKNIQQSFIPCDYN